jgi:hypothetical protein
LRPPSNPKLPSQNLAGSSFLTVVAAFFVGLAGLVAFRRRGETPAAPPPSA